MDILIPIKDQVERINKFNSSLDLNSIITHIDRAEYFFTEGKKNDDEQSFTDVIYRTNQAFEGCSRQAYMILAGKTQNQAQNIKAFQIEIFFIENNILNDRVLPQFKNYRDNWRNESAHNFKLFFSEEEAYFALLSVCSYAYVLFNQMISKLGFDLEKEKLKTKQINLQIMKGKLRKKNLSLREKVIMLIKQFDQDNAIGYVSSIGKVGMFIAEAEIIGMLKAYIEEASDGKIRIGLEQKIYINHPYRADMIMEYEEEKLIVEVKRRLEPSRIRSFVEQVRRYLETIGSSEGVIYVPTSTKENVELKQQDHEVQKTDKPYLISILSK